MQIDYRSGRDRAREHGAKVLFGFILGLIQLTVHAQGVSVQGQAIVNTTTSVSGIPGNSVLQAVPNPVITICSSAGGGIPCTPTVTIYSNVALTTSVANPLPICAPLAPVLGCVDANGNFQFFIAPNATGYVYSQSGSGIVGQLFTIAPQTTVGVGTFGGSITPGQLLYANNGINQIASTANDLWNQSTLTQTLAATTAATAGMNQSSPFLCSGDNFWNGSASTLDTLCWQAVPSAGSNPQVAYNLIHTGSPGGYVVNAQNANLFQTGPLQICNPSVACQLIQVGSGSGNSIQLPLTNPPNANSFLGILSSNGNPNQTAWRNAPWSTAPIDLTGQNNTINTTAWGGSNLIAGAAQYRVSWDAKVTTVAGVSSTLGPLTVTYVDPDGTTQTIICAAQSKLGVIETSDTGNSTTTVLLGVPFLMNLGSSSNFTYAFGYASNAANAMIYNLHLRLEAVQ